MARPYPHNFEPNQQGSAGGSPITPQSTSSQGPSFKTNVNRAKTKRWVEAKSYAYDGDEWGAPEDEDDGYEEPQPQPPPKTTGLRQQGQGITSPQNPNFDGGRYGDLQNNQPAPRTVTNPVGHNRGRPSFDQGDERRAFSGQPAYGPPQHNPPTRFSQMDAVQPPLQIQTQPRRSMEQQNPPRGPPYGAPYSAGPRSRSNDRSPVYPTSYSHPQSTSGSPQVQEPPARFPPRKSSLSQQTPPVIPMKDPSPERSDAGSNPSRGESRERSSSTNAKPLPFIRPADIYKRVAEEKEKERRSQESSRPSLDTAPAKSREESPSGAALRQQGSSESVGRGGRNASLELAEDADSSRRLKPMLDPVAERKSEYGFENLLKSQSSERKPSPPVEPSTAPTPSEPSKPVYDPYQVDRNLAPDYSPDRPDLPSASSNYSDRSLKGSLPNVRRISDFGMDFAAPSSHDPTTEQPTQPSAGNDATGTNVHREPSQGFRTVVREAFDIEHRDVPPTPSSTGDSVVRSNSDSTSAISPIMSIGPSNALVEPRNLAREATPTIPEEPERASSRPSSSGTIGKSQPWVDDSEPLPPPTRPGRTMDRNAPSPGISPARRPIIQPNNNIPRPELAEMSTITPTVSQHSDSAPSGETHGHERFNLPSTTYQGPEAAGAGAAHEPSFGSRKGLPDLPPSKAPDSPILRSESPPKGTVRGLADRFDSQEPLNPPAAPDQPRPNAGRADSFRPALPGGWVSYANTPGVTTPAAESTTAAPEARRGVATPATPKANIETIPDPDVTPTAVKKSAPAEEEPKSSLDPFAAAAAAGAALAGASADTAGSERLGLFGSNEPSKQGMEDQARLARGELHPSRSAMPTLTLPENEAQSSASSQPPTPPPKDKPVQHDSPKAEQSYFPLPLRHKGESSQEKSFTPQRPAMGQSLSIGTSPNEAENDRLREEIMNTLTPRTSNAEDRGRPDLDQSRPSLNVAPTSRAQVESTALPREYESYWNSTAEEDSHRAPDRAYDISDRVAPEMSDNVLLTSPASKAKDLPSLPTNPEAGSSQQSYTHPVIQHRFLWEDSQQSLQTPEHLPDQVKPVEADSPNTIRAPGQLTVFLPTSPMPSGAERSVDEYSQLHNLQTHSATEESNPTRSSYEAGPPLVSPLYPEYGRSPDAERLSTRNSQNISQSDAVPSPQDATFRQSIDNSTNRSVQRSSISEPQRASLDSTHEYLAAPPSVQAVPEGGLTAQSSPISPTTELLSFKKILAMKNPSERINGYNETRQQFSTMDTGLENWLRSTGEALPEHEETMTANGRPISGSEAAHKPSPSRSKFPKIGGLPLAGGDMFRPTHNRQPSGSAFGGGKMSSQQVQAKSKDLLHSASILGGKAGGTAKGWLSKGKTKFRSSGGGDKGVPPIRETNPSPSAQTTSSSIPVSSPSKPTLGTRAVSQARDEIPISYVSTNETPQTNPTAVVEYRDLTISSQASSFAQHPFRRNLEQPQSHPSEVVGNQDQSFPSQASSLAQVSSHQNLEVPSEVTPARSLINQDPFQDPANALPESGEVSRQTSISLVRERSDASSSIPQVNVQPERAKSEVSAISEDAPDTSALENQQSKGSDVPSMAFVSPIQTLSTGGELENGQSRRRSVSPLPSPVAPKDEVEPATTTSYPQRVSPVPPTEPQEEEEEEEAQPTQSQEQPAPSAPQQEVEAAMPSERELPKSELTPAPAQQSEEQIKAVQEFMKPEDIERLTRGAEGGPSGALHVSNLPQYDDPPRRTTQPRPFSFVSQADEEILQTAGEPSPPQDPVRSPQADDLKSMEDELSRPPRSFSRSFQDPNISDHPAFRQDTSSIATTPNQPPYSPQPVDPLINHDRMRYYAHREDFPRQGSTEYQLPGVGPPSQPVVPPQRKLSKSRSRSRSRSGMFRSKSKTRQSVPAEQEREVVEPPPEQKKKRLSIFRTMSRTESESDKDSTMVNAPGSRTDLISQLYHQHPVNNYPSTNNETKEKDGKKIKKLQRSSTSNVVQENTKKKRFSGISSLFGRSGTTGHSGKSGSPSQPLQQVRPTMDPQRVPHPPQPLGNPYPHPYGPSRHASVPSVQTQQYPPQYPPQKYPPQQYPPQGYPTPKSPPQEYHPQMSPSRQHPPQQSPQQYPPEKSPQQYPPQYFPQQQFVGQLPPPGGYYAPQNNPPNPDFIGGRRLSEQRILEAKHGFESQSGFRGPSYPPPQGYPQPRPSPTYTPVSPAQTGQNQGYPQPRPSPTYVPISTAQSRQNKIYPPTSSSQPNGSRRKEDHFARGRTGPHVEHTRELYRRSRSPRSHGYHHSDDYGDETTRDPVKDLGTFRTYSERSSMRGEQEGPWRLSIPEEHDERRHPPRQVQNDFRLPRLDSDEGFSPSTYPLPDSDMMSPINPAASQMPPPPPPKIPLTEQSPPSSSHQRSTSFTPADGVPRNGHSPRPPLPLKDEPKVESPKSPMKVQERTKSPVELDARSTKDTDSEEIVMSSTTYPGQEWQPENWGHWDGD